MFSIVNAPLFAFGFGMATPMLLENVFEKGGERTAEQEEKTTQLELLHIEP